MHRIRIRSFIILTCLMLFGAMVHAQDPQPDCSLDALETRIADISDDVERDTPAYFYQLGDLYTVFSLDCGYQPTLDQITTQIDRTLSLAPLPIIIAQSSVGDNVEQIVSDLQTVNGDSFNGQLLYNGLEMGLDGTELGCAGCHNGEAAPLTEATYTRVEEQRLSLDQFADYTVEQYLVESILQPADYIVPEYASVQMPHNYGTRLDLEQLADLVAYMISQDQLLGEMSDPPMDDALMCDDLSSIDCDTLLADFTGDLERGEALYNGAQPNDDGLYLGCAGCHTGGVIGPMTTGTWQRIIDERLTLPEFEAYTPERYFVESILMPNQYLPDGYVAGVMPLNYSEQLSYQDLADLVAYIQQAE
ncbi:MAG: c-type cytochrome [Anaerolineae bacterium]